MVRALGGGGGKGRGRGREGVREGDEREKERDHLEKLEEPLNLLCYYFT